jgi:hypothetical protein
MRALTLVLVLGLVACGGANLQTIQIVNRSPRPIEELYVYPTGAARGASRGVLAPNASTAVKIKAGHVSVTAISSKLQVDEHTRDQPSATQELELDGPTEVVFHDEGQEPPGLNKQGTIGVVFLIPHSKAPRSEEPQAAPAPDAP